MCRHLYDADASVVRTVPPQPALRHGVGVQPVLGEEEEPRAGAALQRLADVVRPPPSTEIRPLALVIGCSAGNRSHFYKDDIYLVLLISLKPCKIWAIFLEPVTT